MIYIIGFIGFISGFVLGQMILLALLKDRSRQDLLNDRTIRWKYGILNWMIAGLGAYSFVVLYRLYF